MENSAAPAEAAEAAPSTSLDRPVNFLTFDFLFCKRLVY